MNKKICAVFMALLMAVSAAACKDKEKTADNVQTNDTAVQSTPVEEPDIGEHKDYDTKKARAYLSNGILVVDQDDVKRGMEILDKDADMSYAEFYGNELNTIKDRLGAKVNVYSMIVPTACEFYCPANERWQIKSQEEVMTYVRDMLVNVKEVNLLPILRNHNAEEIYYRTDNRWTSLGAYYAGKAFAKIAGVDYADISQYEKKVISDKYFGNLYVSLDEKGITDLEACPDNFVYYEPKCKYNTYYYDEEFEYLTEDKFFEEVPDNLYDSYFKGGYYCLKMTSKVKNGRKLIIVKDSFGTPLAPFFTSSFEEIYVVDLEYLEANLVEMIQEFEITDVLYVMNSFSVTGNRVYSLETLRTQATHGTLNDAAPEEDIIDTDKEKKSTDGSDTDSDTYSQTQYVYDVGLNNQVGVYVDSQVVPLDEYYAYSSAAQPEDDYTYEDEITGVYEEDGAGEGTAQEDDFFE